MGKKRGSARRRSKWTSVRYSRKFFDMPPWLIILGNRLLYFFTLLFLILSVARLVLHIGFQWTDVPLDCLFWGVMTVSAALLFAFKLPQLSTALIVLAVFLYASDYLLPLQRA